MCLASRRTGRRMIPVPPHVPGLRHPPRSLQVATLAYGLGNWYLVRGDKAQARRWFERSIQSDG